MLRNFVRLTFDETYHYSSHNSSSVVWIKQHDHILDSKGFNMGKHKTHRLPISGTLRRKKKYRNLKDIEPILYHDIKSGTVPKIELPLPSSNFEEYQALRLCRGDQLRVLNFNELNVIYCTLTQMT